MFGGATQPQTAGLTQGFLNQIQAPQLGAGIFGNHTQPQGLGAGLFGQIAPPDSETTTVLKNTQGLLKPESQ